MKKPSTKPLRFLADESLGLKVVHNLASLGYDILAIAQIARGTDDADVLARALEQERILITTDKDFGYLVFKEKLNTHGVILLRLKEESVSNLTSYVRNFINNYSNKMKGRFIVITEDKVRIKKI